MRISLGHFEVLMHACKRQAWKAKSSNQDPTGSLCHIDNALLAYLVGTCRVSTRNAGGRAGSAAGARKGYVRLVLTGMYDLATVCGRQ